MSGAFFVDCTFKNCKSGERPGNTFSEATFDSTCQLNDLRELVTLAKADPDDQSLQIELELTRFLKSFKQEDRLVKRTIQEIALSSHIAGLGYDGLMRFVKEGFVVKNVCKDKTVEFVISKHAQ